MMEVIAAWRENRSAAAAKEALRCLSRQSETGTLSPDDIKMMVADSLGAPAEVESADDLFNEAVLFQTGQRLVGPAFWELPRAHETASALRGAAEVLHLQAV